MRTEARSLSAPADRPAEACTSGRPTLVAVILALSSLPEENDLDGLLEAPRRVRQAGADCSAVLLRVPHWFYFFRDFRVKVLPQVQCTSLLECFVYILPICVSKSTSIYI